MPNGSLRRVSSSLTFSGQKRDLTSLSVSWLVEVLTSGLPPDGNQTFSSSISLFSVKDFDIPFKELLVSDVCRYGHFVHLFHSIENIYSPIYLQFLFFRILFHFYPLFTWNNFGFYHANLFSRLYYVVIFNFISCIFVSVQLLARLATCGFIACASAALVLNLGCPSHLKFQQIFRTNSYVLRVHIFYYRFNFLSPSRLFRVLIFSWAPFHLFSGVPVDAFEFCSPFWVLLHPHLTVSYFFSGLWALLAPRVSFRLLFLSTGNWHSCLSLFP